MSRLSNVANIYGFVHYNSTRFVLYMCINNSANIGPPNFVQSEKKSTSDSIIQRSRIEIMCATIDVNISSSNASKKKNWWDCPNDWAEVIAATVQKGFIVSGNRRVILGIQKSYKMVIFHLHIGIRIQRRCNETMRRWLLVSRKI